MGQDRRMSEMGQKQTFSVMRSMSAKGQKQTCVGLG